jgi:hypothetical protein
MPALVAGIHALLVELYQKAWMAGTSPAMTMWKVTMNDGSNYTPHAL